MTVSENNTTLLELKDLSVGFVRQKRELTITTDLNFDVKSGEVLCLLGESGSGKTVTLRSMMRLLPRRTTRLAGEIRFSGEDLVTMKTRRLNALRGSEIAMVFQESSIAFDPVFTIGKQMAEVILRHTDMSMKEALQRASELLDLVQIPSARRCLNSYPHELSGGMCQRAMIALALSCRPKLLLADEPTTALDATVQMQILLLLRDIQQEFDMSMILVTHDIGVAAEMADRVAVMYAGRIVEIGDAREVIGNPKHPYTEGLLASTRGGGFTRGRKLQVIPGAPPDPTALPPGCSFAPRCPKAHNACRGEVPRERNVNGSRVRCVLYDEK